MLTLKIGPDDVLETPREWDNRGKMVCFHKRHNLGDKHTLKSDAFHSWDDVEEYLVKECDAIVVLPLYLFDHSGLTMSTSPFSCPWDSGQVGFIYAEKGAVLKEFNRSRLTKKLLQRVTEQLQSEVKVYDQYLQGDVHYVSVVDEQGTVIDSCGGMYGLKYAEEEGQRMLKECESALAEEG